MNLPLLHWSSLSAEARRETLRRPAQADGDALQRQVRAIVEDVRVRGDVALREYAAKFDGATLSSFEVEEDEIEQARAALSASQVASLQRAIDNVRKFHTAQHQPVLRVETSPGVVCERHFRAIDAVGLYVPAGVAPLPSAAIMTAVPAAIAGCGARILCTPPRKDGTADPAVLVAARMCDVGRIFKVGGAQAIAAMAYGTETVPKVDKVFGPGSAWVTAAKLYCANDPEGAALDLPAGPSEVLVIADESARAEFIAADLLAQAEHSNDAQVVFVTVSEALARMVSAELAEQMRRLGRESTLRASIDHARIIVVESVEQAFEVSNAYAPEHLIVQLRDARNWLNHVRNAGSVFLGFWTPETMGDYCSGTNHVLPTYGFARAYSGLSLVDFMKRITVQEITPEGLKDLGPTAIDIATLEGLDAHANAVEVRLTHLSGAAARGSR